MPAGAATWKVLHQLNDVCRDLTWLKDHPHYAELRKRGHFDTIDAQCAGWAAVDDLMARHVEADMLLESREAIRQAVVTAAENGLPLRWEITARIDLLKVVVARVEDGTVKLFVPRAARDEAAVPSGRIPA